MTGLQPQPTLDKIARKLREFFLYRDLEERTSAESAGFCEEGRVLYLSYCENPQANRGFPHHAVHCKKCRDVFVTFLCS